MFLPPFFRRVAQACHAALPSPPFPRCLRLLGPASWSPIWASLGNKPESGAFRSDSETPPTVRWGFQEAKKQCSNVLFREILKKILEELTV